MEFWDETELESLPCPSCFIKIKRSICEIHPVREQCWEYLYLTKSNSGQGKFVQWSELNKMCVIRGYTNMKKLWNTWTTSHNGTHQYQVSELVTRMSWRSEFLSYLYICIMLCVKYVILQSDCLLLKTLEVAPWWYVLLISISKA